MNLRPIPKSVLGSTMSVRVPIDGRRGYSDAMFVTHVRFQDVKVLETSSYAIDDDSTGIIYMDAVNSVGAFDIPVGSLISVDGGEERSVVKTTKEVGFGNKVHHWKIEVR